MLKSISNCALVLLCAALAGCGRDAVEANDVKAAERSDDGPIVLAVMPELPPYAYIDTNNGAICGIDLDIVKSVAERLGRKLEIRKMPFGDLISSVRDHDADFAAGAITITDGRSHDVNFSLPYAEEGAAFIYRAGEPMPTMVRAEGLRVGAVESMTHDFYLTRHGIDPFRYKSVENAIEALLTQKIDAVFYDRPALVEISRMAGGKLSVTPLETRENYGIAVRKDRNDYLEAVNAVIRERKAK